MDRHLVPFGDGAHAATGGSELFGHHLEDVHISQAASTLRHSESVLTFCLLPRRVLFALGAPSTGHSGTPKKGGSRGW